MKSLGIDYGTKRIGIAISDEEGKLAFPHEVIENNNKIFQKLEEFIVTNNIEEVVIGESKNYKMQDNEVMQEISDFKAVLENSLDIPVFLHPEFMTSVQAEKIQGKNDMIDASAASIILQSYLDQK